MTISRAECAALDAADPLASLRMQFSMPADIIYLDGNSLGALPAFAAAHMQQVVAEQWGRDLIGSWNAHDWINAPVRLGAAIAPLIGAAAHEVLVADTLSINLFKLLCGALALRPGRRAIVSEHGNFPTDIYMLQGLRGLLGDLDLRIVAPGDILGALDDDVAVLMLSQVHYKSGRRWNMAELTRAAHEVGALMLWDLAHSAGAIAVDLNACDADLAAGCGYKFLNGGPGAPSFLFVAARHQAGMTSPLTGWLGHETPFTFADDYRPAADIRRMLCSSPSILALSALEAALQIWRGVDTATVEAKAGRLGDLFIALVEHGTSLQLASPREAAARGAQISFAHDDAYAIMQALIARGVIGDFRAPDLIRFGFAPLTTRYTDAFDAATILAEVLATGAYRDRKFSNRQTVT